MKSARQDRMAEIVRQQLALFIETEAGSQSLITVTRVDISPDFRNVIVFISVLPDEQAHTALKFLKRKEYDMRTYLKKNLQTRIIPKVTVSLDYGEKNRQRVDELLIEEKRNSSDEEE